jgi:hypothetical protein
MGSYYFDYIKDTVFKVVFIKGGAVGAITGGLNRSFEFV